MFDVVSMLLLIAAEPEPSPIRVIRVAPSLAEEAKARQEAEAAAQEGPRPEIEDPMMGLRSDDYPADSLRNGEEGNVRIALDVDAEGKPTHCTVFQSSGHAGLDQRTCQVGMERARFRPARDQQGKSVASVWKSPPVRWRVPEGGNQALHLGEYYYAATIQIAAGGTFGQCTVEASAGVPIPDACEMTKIRHGKNVRDLARWWQSITEVVATSNKETPPDVSKPAWGRRESRLVSAQVTLDGIPYPVACDTIIAEGWAFGGNGCPPPDKLAPTPANPDWSKARTTYVEVSTFGQLR